MSKEEVGNETVPEKGEKQNTLVLKAEDTDSGAISISPNVIAEIVKKAALGVPGVARFAPKGLLDLANLFSDRSFDSSMAIVFGEGKVSITLSLILYFDAVVPETVRNVQKQVKTAVESKIGPVIRKIDIFVKDLTERENEAGADNGEGAAEETDPALK